MCTEYSKGFVSDGSKDNLPKLQKNRQGRFYKSVVLLRTGKGLMKKIATMCDQQDRDATLKVELQQLATEANV